VNTGQSQLNGNGTTVSHALAPPQHTRLDRSPAPTGAHISTVPLHLHLATQAPATVMAPITSDIDGLAEGIAIDMDGPNGGSGAREGRGRDRPTSACGGG
jgi:hypothetical protein